MTNYPLVSIITPSYNQAQYLEQTILSVLNQNYPNLEYWIIDGRSTDGSLDIIKKYASQIKGWISEKDGGQAEAINKGFKKASGSIIAWLNSDDVYREGAIRSMVETFLNYQDIGLVFSDVESIDSKGEVFNVMGFGDWGLKDLMTFKIIGQPGVFFRKEALDRAGYLDLSYRYLLDHHLWLRIALKTKIKYIPGKIWAAARFHPEAKNVAQAQNFGKEAFQMAIWMERQPEFQPYLQRRKMWAGAYRLDAFYQLDAEKPKNSLRSYWKCFWQDPFTLFQDWRRIIYTLFFPLGISKLREAYIKKRKRNFVGKAKNSSGEK